MNDEELRLEVINLIRSRREGDYWDFKQEHHSNLGDLLHDIICMANNRVDRDAYIIYGINDSTFEIIGTQDSDNRKTQQNIIDFLRDKSFAGGVRPIVELRTLNIESREIDVLVVKNTNDTPYYLTNSYQGVFANQIYTRVRDTNTPKTGNADINHIEELWKKRFMLNRTPLQRIEHKLGDFNDWIREGEYYYNIYNPEYRLELMEEDEERSIAEFYSYKMTNETTAYQELQIKYYDTRLHTMHLVYLDSYRLVVPIPSVGFIKDCNDRVIQEYLFKYYIRGTFDFKMLEFLIEKQSYDYEEALINLNEIILTFNSIIEKDNFINFIEERLEELEAIINSDDECYDSIIVNDGIDIDVIIRKLKVGKALNGMLNNFRGIDIEQ